ncbi:antirestriction protein ArdA [Embleya hyalina]|uniref:Antirestriction protein n=1 Tax=Embleya hyalina TaxID=516124 RepID=A0A401YZ75_9ACTN|nr:antirestriction protein ArdA [Embleya hyalina]GCD99888.1 hypothetical protein EHYA_07610 [Embleya hyalina]
MSTERIYVASLSDYNHEILHGAWIDVADNTESGIWDEIEAMLKASPTARKYGEAAEEWAIHDSEGFDPIAIGEYTPIGDLVIYSRLIETCGSAVLAHFLGENTCALNELERHIKDRYVGTHDSFREFSDSYADAMLSEYPDFITEYFDYESYARDLENAYDVVQAPDGVHIFADN